LRTITFRVDGTLIDAGALMKNFRPSDGLRMPACRTERETGFSWGAVDERDARVDDGPGCPLVPEEQREGSEEDFPEFAATVVKRYGHHIANNPRNLTEKDLLKIYEMAW